jgi:hypothetical protein
MASRRSGPRCQIGNGAASISPDKASSAAVSRPTSVPSVPVRASASVASNSHRSVERSGKGAGAGPPSTRSTRAEACPRTFSDIGPPVARLSRTAALSRSEASSPSASQRRERLAGISAKPSNREARSPASSVSSSPTSNGAAGPASSSARQRSRSRLASPPAALALSARNTSQVASASHRPETSATNIIAVLESSTEAMRGKP